MADFLLALNVGSSSTKFGVFEMQRGVAPVLCGRLQHGDLGWEIAESDGAGHCPLSSSQTRFWNNSFAFRQEKACMKAST